MDHKPIKHEETVLDIEQHEGESRSKVWIRRILFAVVVLLCVSFAAPTFGSCSGALGSGGHNLWGVFNVGGRRVEVYEDEFRRAHSRLAAVFRLFAPDRQLDDDAIWSHLMLDAAARAEGVRVTDDQVVRLLATHPAFQRDGKFDEAAYRGEIRQLARVTGVDHEGFTAAVRALLRTETYTGVYASAYSVPQGREAYEDWKKKNLKVTVEYVVQPYDPLRRKSAELPVSDEELRGAASLPQIVALRTVPARRGLEAAYARAAEMTDAEKAEAEKFVAENELLGKGQTLEQTAWNWFWANRNPATGFYHRESWAALRKDEHEAALAAWRATPEPRAPGSEPKDPVADWPEKPADQFYGRWFDFVSREMLARAVVEHMAKRAERESVSLASLAADYAKYGVRVVATAEPLTDAEIAEKFPAGLGRWSSLGQVVTSQFPAPPQGTAFAPRVVTEPVPTCTVVARPRDRGFLVVRSTSHEAARERDVLEVRQQAEAMFRIHRINEFARQALEAVRAKVEAAGADPAARLAAMRAAAAEAGLESRQVGPFNARSARPRVAALPPDATEAQRAQRDRNAYRERILGDYAVLSTLEPGKLREPIMIDAEGGAAYLALVVDRREPEPVEMDESTVRSERYLRAYQQRSEMAKLLAPAELKKRFALELTEAGRKATERVPKDADSQEPDPAE